MATWSNEKIVNFLNEIRVHPELWDVASLVYRDRKLKRDTWASIAAQFDTTPDEAYNKFRNLRTYARTMQRKKSADGKQVPWFAYKAISFILSGDIPDSETESEPAIEIASPATPPKIFCHKININKTEIAETSSEEVPEITEVPQETESDDTRTPYSAFGEHVANKLNTYDSYTRAQVEFKISKILYYADMGIFKRASRRQYSE